MGRYAPHVAACLHAPCLWPDGRHAPPLALASWPRAASRPVSLDRGVSRATFVSAPLAKGRYAPHRAACVGCEIRRDSWPRGVTRHL